MRLSTVSIIAKTIFLLEVYKKNNVNNNLNARELNFHNQAARN